MLLFNKKIAINRKRTFHIGTTALLIAGLIAPVVFPTQVKATGSGYVRLDRLKASTTTGGTVCTTTTTSGTEADVQVTFPTGFTVNGTNTNWTVTTTNLPSGATAWPGIGTASGVSGQTVTFPSNDLSTGTLYCFNFSGTSTLTNSTAGNDKTATIITRTGGSVPIDTINYALSIISEDQISVTATVPSTFSFALGSNTAALGSISTSSVTSATGITATMNTNATNGWIAWVKSANAALSSAASADSIASPGTNNDSPESLAAQSGYLLDSDLTTDGSGGGTVSIAAEYNGADANSGGHLATTFQPIASANGPASGDVVTLVVRAKASATTKAASDYADTLTVTAAGQF